jgi:hypothetical protein
MYLDLEKSKFNESFKSMEKIFIDLNINPVFFSSTKEEFSNSMLYKKETVLKVVEKYASEIISDTDDPFIKTALQRQCITKQDFEQFFDQISNLPTFVAESLEIKLYETADLNSVIQAGQKNEKIKNRINNIYKRKRKRNKNEELLEHDAGLIAGAEFLRKNKKCFILTRDTTINELALNKPLRNEMPIALSLYTLINVLAIDNGGTDIDPTNYAPLFASVIKLALIPEQDIFKVEDLSRMLDLQSQIADLPTKDILKIARDYHHNHITGVDDEEAALQFTRSFQAAKLELQTDLEKVKNEKSFIKKEKDKYQELSGKAINVLQSNYEEQLRDKYDWERTLNRILYFILLPLLSIALTWLFIQKNQNINQRLIGLALNIIIWFITNFVFTKKKIFSKYSERVNRIKDEAKKKVVNDMK